MMLDRAAAGNTPPEIQLKPQDLSREIQLPRMYVYDMPNDSCCSYHIIENVRALGWKFLCRSFASVFS